MPAGTQIGDIIFAVINSAGSAHPPTVGTWNILHDNDATGWNTIFWHRVVAGDPSSYSADGSSVIGGGGLVAVRGLSPTGTPSFDVIAQGTTSATPIVAPLITPTSGKGELYLLWNNIGIYDTLGASPGLTSLWNVSDPTYGNTTGLSLSQTNGSTAFASSSTPYSTKEPSGGLYQQLLLERATYGPYASLYNNATDGSVLYVTGVTVDFDVADQLQVYLVSGPDSAPYAAPYGCFANNPRNPAPVGQLFSTPIQQAIAFLYETPSTVSHYQLEPSPGSYIVALPPGYGLALTHGANLAKQFGAHFDYLVLPS